MDISEAVKALQKAEKTVLLCSTHEQVESFRREKEWFVLITGEFEDGTEDRMEMKMSRFVGLYAPQKFTAGKASENNAKG